VCGTWSGFVLWLSQYAVGGGAYRATRCRGGQDLAARSERRWRRRCACDSEALDGAGVSSGSHAAPCGAHICGAGWCPPPLSTSKQAGNTHTVIVQRKWRILVAEIAQSSFNLDYNFQTFFFASINA